ncbi:hypothetical protein RAN53_09670 [Halomonas sp. SSL-5]|uniref:hypothetical protein n=1 Tax=Halomonas sp. SSL-5 TaxID=3065855 RepID=UPI0027393F9E|nr:hypothetical protein [Halomonas sp. SSL-5]MDY7116618.1 hypothetical protein [Halomonas sp. SSL-5]
MIKEFILLVMAIIFVHPILMKIFSVTTYHKYFFKSSPILVGYSILTGWLVFEFVAPGFILWFFAIEAALLALGLMPMRKAAKGASEIGHTSSELAMSIRLTFAYYILSSITFLVTAFLAYLYFFNT